MPSLPPPFLRLPKKRKKSREEGDESLGGTIYCIIHNATLVWLVTGRQVVKKSGDVFHACLY